MDDITANLTAIRARMEAAAKAAGHGGLPQLVAVSKNHSVAAIETALAAGQQIFGENRVQEAAEKFAGLRQMHPALRLHLIGPLQTNKAEAAVKLFDVIETLDRPRLAAALAAAMRKQNHAVPCLIEINIGNEPQKAGLAPQALGDFLRLCRDTHGLRIDGLMCIPPQHGAPLHHFNALRALAAAHGLNQLSMGMSGDFEAAIACGATSVRIGSALFGARA